MKPTKSLPTPAAKNVNSAQRQQLALDAISGDKPITEIAQQHEVSRKFIYTQKRKAINAVKETFNDKADDDSDVLFYLPVTKKWICQFILCLLMHCRANFRGIIKTMADTFDYDISIGTIHNISRQASEQARHINEKQDLRKVKLCANDELFHHNKPILSGIDIPSLYCYLLAQENQRDGDTWAIHLWDLEQQGYQPERIFADDGDGLRKGHKQALPKVPCDADHFHIITKLTNMRRFFRNRLKIAITYKKQMAAKMEKAKQKGKAHQHAKKLGLANQDYQQMIFLSSTIDTLVSWMAHDVLDKAGHAPRARNELFDFIVDELQKLADIHPHRIQDVCTALRNQKHLLLAFADVLNTKFEQIAEDFDSTEKVIWDICQLQRCQYGSNNYLIRSVPLQLALGDKRFYDIEDAVISAMSQTERTSSMVENLHSRIRPYFYLRQEVGQDYLELLRFYLNHTPFLRSEVHRKGKTPAELLTEQPHPHWLSLLGYTPFKRAA